MKEYPRPLSPEDFDKVASPEDVVFCGCCGQFYHIDDVVWMEEDGASGFAACKQCGDILESTQTEQRFFFRYKKWFGHLQFREWNNVDSLGELEEIDGIFDIRYSPKPSSLGKLKRISESANFIGTNIECLSPLEYVGYSLSLGSSKVRSLGTLEYIGEDLRASDSMLEDLGNLKHVGKNAFLSGAGISTLSKLEHVGTCLYANNTKVNSLGNLKTVGQYLDLSGTKVKEIDRFDDTDCHFGLAYNHMESLGAIVHAGGFNLVNTTMESLGKLEKVDYDFLGKGLDTQSLCNLKYVGGTLDLRDSAIEDFGMLRYVGENLYLPDWMRGHLQLKNIEVKGCTRFYKQNSSTVRN